MDTGIPSLSNALAIGDLTLSPMGSRMDHAPSKPSPFGVTGTSKLSEFGPFGSSMMDSKLPPFPSSAFNFISPYPEAPGSSFLSTVRQNLEASRRMLDSPFSSSFAQTPSSLGRGMQAPASSSVRMWDRSAVQAWIRSCAVEYELADVRPDNFQMNGKALMLLSRSDFIQRSPASGDILYQALQRLISPPCNGPSPRSSPAGSPWLPPTPPSGVSMSSGSSTGASIGGMPSRPGSTAGSHDPFTPMGGLFTSLGDLKQRIEDGFPSSAALTPVSMTSDHHHHHPSDGKPSPLPPSHTRIKEDFSYSPDPRMDMSAMDSASAHSPGSDAQRHFIEGKYADDCHDPDDCDDVPMQLPEELADCRVLWSFLLQLLKDERFRDTIRWDKPEEKIFRICNPAKLAKLWGIRKNRPKMTYEKLSRAIRYYYRMGIIRRMPGRKLTYQFMKPAEEVQSISSFWKPSTHQDHQRAKERLERENAMKAQAKFDECGALDLSRNAHASVTVNVAPNQVGRPVQVVLSRGVDVKQPGTVINSHSAMAGGFHSTGTAINSHSAMNGGLHLAGTVINSHPAMSSGLHSSGTVTVSPSQVGKPVQVVLSRPNELRQPAFETEFKPSPMMLGEEKTITFQCQPIKERLKSQMRQPNGSHLARVLLMEQQSHGYKS